MKRYFLRLFNDGDWELYDSGQIICEGSSWSAGLADQLYRMLTNRERSAPITAHSPDFEDHDGYTAIGC